jgi:hypothetical protein
MKKGILFCLAVIFINSLLIAQTPILAPGMAITCLNTCTSNPGETVDNAIDGNSATKFLDLNIFNTGFEVNTALPGKVATIIQLTTANDFSGRDPFDVTVDGSNDGLSWTNISSGAIPIPCDPTRFYTRNFSFSNATAYSWYRVSFSTTCAQSIGNPPYTDPEDYNSMQIAEVQLFEAYILPVKLLSFTAQEKNNKGAISWKLAQPDDGTLFELQKSNDGVNFTTIYSKTADLNTVEYSFTDQSLLASGSYYYRLKMVDKLNKLSYSNIALLKTGLATVGVTIYPNPIRTGNNIQISTSNTTIESIKLVNNIGQVLMQKENIRVNGSTNLQLPEKLQTGVYYLILNTDKGIRNEKILIQQ